SRDFGVFHRRVSDVNISEAANPAPSLRHSMRNGRSVTPAMGASTTGEGRTYGPICMRLEEPFALTRDGIVRADNAAGGRRQAGIDLESYGVGTRVHKCHFGINTLARG